MRSSPNSALLTNSTIVESARLLSGHRPPECDDFTSKITQLFEFCNLAECVVLNETIYSLPSKTPEDAEDSPFFVALKKSGIVSQDIPAEPRSRAIAATRRLLGHIGNDRVYSWALGLTEESDIRLVDDVKIGNDCLFIRDFAFQLRSIDFDPDATRSILSNPRHRGYFTGPEELDNRPVSINDYLATLNEDLQCHVSPHTGYVVHQIRNVVYWSLAETFDLSYSPDALRVEWLQGWNKRWRSSLAETLYGVVADAFSTKAEAVRGDDEARSVLLPPMASLVAERARGPGDVVDVLLNLRKEFETFRADLAGLVDEQRQARSIAARTKAAARIKRLYDAVSAKAAYAPSATLSTALGYSGALVGVVADPLSLKAYAALADRGSDWIRTWWNARPASRLLALQQRLERLPDYWSLARALTGESFSDQDVRAFEHYRTAYGAFRAARPPAV